MGEGRRDCNSQREYKLRAKALYRQQEKNSLFAQKKVFFS